MTTNSIFQVGLYFSLLLAAAYPLGIYMAAVYAGRPTWLSPVLGPLERLLYTLSGVNPESEMTWQRYALALLLSNGLGIAAVYLLQISQGSLPLNPQQLPGVAHDLALNTAISFATNTNWQSYGGEVTLSYLTQSLALTVQNFLSAATSMAVLVAFVRGLTRTTARTIGNFWVDLIRGTLFILLPLASVLTLLLVWQGVVQTYGDYPTVSRLEPAVTASGEIVKDQTLAVGPAASQIAIKQLGTNGGGFFNVNSAHPFENPTPVSNFLQLLAILLIPAALCITFGRLSGDLRQGWALLAAMSILFVALLIPCLIFEQQGTPVLAKIGADLNASTLQPGGNMEGKETRFGITNSVLWATATTAASNGSVNSMHDSFTPLGGLIPMWLMQLGEVIFGGVGSGLYGMLMFVLIAVFIAGLMVGRTPEYLQKKIEAWEMKMAMLAILIPCAAVLLGTAVAVSLAAGRAGVFNPGPHGFSEVLYAFSSASNNNGSAFAGLGANNLFYNTALGVAMLCGRYGVLLPVLAVAGSLAAKRATPVSAGTLPTHTPLFVALLLAVVIVIGALSFFPALALGPIVEHLQLTH